MSRVLPAVVCGYLCLFALPASGQTVLTFEEALARARTQAGAPLVARARVAEAESGLSDVRARFRQNPVLEAAAGPRFGAGTRVTDLDVSVSQMLDARGARQARIDQVSASVARRRAEADTATQAAQLDAATAFIEALAATDQLRVAGQAAQIDRDLLAATQRRFDAGDVSAIDLNLARLAAARSTVDASAAEAAVSEATGRLRVLLRIPDGETVRVDGALERAAPALAELEAAIPRRPEFAALDADLRDADALSRLGIAAARPELGVRAAFEREDGNNIVLGGVSLTLPAFQRGASLREAGLAAASRARIERDVLQATAIAELRTAYAVYEQRAAAARTFADAALPVVQDNETLAQRSYEAGEMSLLDLLQIRRAAVETRMTTVSHRLAAALERLELDRVAGVLR